jgi:hypothetical protein
MPWHQGFVLLPSCPRGRLGLLRFMFSRARACLTAQSLGLSWFDLTVLDFCESLSSACLIANSCRWKSVLFLSRRIQDSSFPSFLLCFLGGISVTHERCSMKCLWGGRSYSEELCLISQLSPLSVYSHDLLVDLWVVDLLDLFCASAQVLFS